MIFFSTLHEHNYTVLNITVMKKKNLNANISTGILAVATPCGIVVDVKELFNSESKTQVYAHLHQILKNPSMAKTGNHNSKKSTFNQDNI